MLLVIQILSALIFWSGCKGSTDESPSSQPQARAAGGLNSKNRLGERHLRFGRYQPALKAFRAALVNAEDSVRAYVGLSHAHLELGELPQAAATLDLANALDPSRAEVFYARSLICLRLYATTHQGTLLDQGLAAARQAVLLNPDQKAYFYVLGSLYSYRDDLHATHAGDLDSAEVAYRRALQLDPGLAAAYGRLGSIYKYQGRFAAAEKAYRQQLELQPQNTRARSDLAILCRNDGRLAEARLLLEEAVRMDTGLTVAYLNLGQLYMQAGKTEAGQQALKRFRELSARDLQQKDREVRERTKKRGESE